MTVMHSSASWVGQAACAGTDPKIFFPDNPGYADYAAARTVCDSCPVRQLCLEFAITRGLRYGVFGGYTPDEREAYRKKHALTVTHSQRMLAPHGSAGAYNRHVRHHEPACDTCRTWKTAQRKGA